MERSRVSLKAGVWRQARCGNGGTYVEVVCVDPHGGKEWTAARLRRTNATKECQGRTVVVGSTKACLHRDKGV